MSVCLCYFEAGLLSELNEQSSTNTIILIEGLFFGLVVLLLPNLQIYLQPKRRSSPVHALKIKCALFFDSVSTVETLILKL